MILKHKGNLSKMSGGPGSNLSSIAGNSSHLHNLNRLDQRYIQELIASRNGSQSQLQQYENILNVELNEQYRAHGLKINNQASE